MGTLSSYSHAAFDENGSIEWSGARCPLNCPIYPSERVGSGRSAPRAEPGDPHGPSPRLRQKSVLLMHWPDSCTGQSFYYTRGNFSYFRRDNRSVYTNRCRPVAGGCWTRQDIRFLSYTRSQAHTQLRPHCSHAPVFPPFRFPPSTHQTR